MEVRESECKTRSNNYRKHRDRSVYVFLYGSHRHICLLKKSAAFLLTAVSWLFLVVKQKLSSKVVKLEEFKKNKHAVK